MLNKSPTAPPSVMPKLDELAHFIVRNHSTMPLPVSSFSTDNFFSIDESARIKVIGVGTRGAAMAQILSRNLPGITSHEVIADLNADSAELMTALLSSVQKSDLLFILTGFDDEYCGRVARTIGQTAREGGALTLAVIPDELGPLPQSLAELAQGVDTVFFVSDGSMVDIEAPRLVQKDALTGYAMRHLVTATANLILQHSMICVDFADIVTTMRGGKNGRLGVGVAVGPDRGGVAAQQAVERLAAQGITMLDATGILAIVQGSSLMTMEDFDDVSRVIHDYAAEDANIIVGFITDDPLGYNVRVSVMSLQ